MAARQLGLNQLPPCFIIHENFQSRADLTERLTANRAYDLFSDLAIPIPHDLEFTYSSEGFDPWWTCWKTHLFRGPFGILLISTNPSHVPTQEEVSSPIRILPKYRCTSAIDLNIIFLCSSKKNRSPRMSRGSHFSMYLRHQHPCTARMPLPWRRSCLLPPRQDAGTTTHASHRPRNPG